MHNQLPKDTGCSLAIVAMGPNKDINIFKYSLLSVIKDSLNNASAVIDEPDGVALS